MAGEAVELEQQRALGLYEKKCRFDDWKSEARQRTRFESLRKAVEERFDAQQAVQAEVSDLEIALSVRSPQTIVCALPLLASTSFLFVHLCSRVSL